MTRLGYQQGLKDAECLRQGPEADLSRLMAQGPRLREIEGFVRNQAMERMQYNTESGEFWGDCLWRASWEAQAHLNHLGTSGTPACWMMTGYACGFTTAMMGRPILWRELECVAMGHACCRVIGRPLEECPDAEEDLRFLQIEDFVAAPRGRQSSASAHKAPTPGPNEAGANALGEDVVGASRGFNAVIHLIKRVAPTDATVLLNGESGVGKERFAKMLHRIGPRADRALISVNRAATPAELLESELLGVEKGAYTGATACRPGRFERADSGTLFLDEIGILSMPAQGKLLRALQESEIERVGGTQTRRVDVRLVAATNLDLREEVKAGRFREDLFFRLNVFPVRVPPLRERRQDIPVFMNHFLQKYSRRHARSVTGFTGRAIDALLNYAWPGNVRELENMIERGVILAPAGGAIDTTHLFTGGEKVDAGGFELRRDGRVCAGDGSLAERPATEADRVRRKVGSLLGDAADCSEGEADDISLEEIETALLKSAVRVAEGNLAAAARSLGITRPQLVYRLKSRGLLGAEH